jgi:hypothetical protein
MADTENRKMVSLTAMPHSSSVTHSQQKSCKSPEMMAYSNHKINQSQIAYLQKWHVNFTKNRLELAICAFKDRHTINLQLNRNFTSVFCTFI